MNTTAAILCCAALAPAATANILDQEHDVPFGSSSGVLGGVSQMQGVTAGLTGQVSRIEFFSHANASYSGSVEVFISAGVAPQTAPWDYSVTIDAATLTGGGWWGVDVTAAGLSFTAGDQYTIGVANTTGSAFFGLAGGGTIYSAYAGGSQWSIQPGFNSGLPYQPFADEGTIDLLFRTYITPAPASLAVLTAGCVVFRRRR